jgi:hypothetical protein
LFIDDRINVFGGASTSCAGVNTITTTQDKENVEPLLSNDNSPDSANVFSRPITSTSAFELSDYFTKTTDFKMGIKRLSQHKGEFLFRSHDVTKLQEMANSNSEGFQTIHRNLPKSTI